MRQAVECHHVLRSLHQILSSCVDKYRPEMWPMTLQYLISINDRLLSPAFTADDMSEQLSWRIFGVLLELWIGACAAKQFPLPPYWLRLQLSVNEWRHRLAVIDQLAKYIFTLSFAPFDDWDVGVSKKYFFSLYFF